MENVGNKKAWIAVFSVFGVVIVGLVIAIIAVAINRNNSSEVAENIDSEYDEALTIYFNDNGEISDTAISQKLDIQETLKLLKEKIDVAENEMTKAMLEKDYYLIEFSLNDNDDAKKNEILNGLIRVDEILKTADSSEAVANVAFAYHDFDMYDKYVAITKERNPDFQSVYDAIKEMSK